MAMQGVKLMEFKIGQIVEHVLSKDWVLVLEILEDTILCRAKDLELYKFYPIELRTISTKTK